MSKYAGFDHTKSGPSEVTGWYDTDATNYVVIPHASDLFELTEAEWAGRMVGLWAVSDGHLVAHVRPPSKEWAANEARKAAIAKGITVTSVSAPDQNGTYALDDAAEARIFREGLFAAQFSAFTDGQETLDYPDQSGVLHTFTVDQFVALFRKVAPLTTRLAKQAEIMASGGTPSWPDQTADLP